MPSKMTADNVLWTLSDDNYNQKLKLISLWILFNDNHIQKLKLMCRGEQ